MTNIPLADALKKLRDDLSVVQADGAEKNANIKFEIQDISLELTLTAELFGEGKADVKWYLFNASAGVSAKDVVTQKLTLSLKALDETTGKEANINNEIEGGV